MSAQSINHQRGNQLFKDGQYEEAIAVFLQCHKEEKVKKGAFYSNISLCYMKLGQPQEALKYARMCVSETPDFDKGYFRLYYAALETNQLGTALIAAQYAPDQLDINKLWEDYFMSTIFEVKEISETLGKGVFSKKEHQVNEIIYTETPVIASAKYKNYKNCCLYCLKALFPNESNTYTSVFNTNVVKGVKCKCGYVYCSKKCQDLDVGHQLVCGKLNKVVSFCTERCVSHPLTITKMFAKVLSATYREPTIYPFVVFHAQPLVKFDMTVEKIFVEIFGNKLETFQDFGGWKYVYRIMSSVLKYNASTILPLNAIQMLATDPQKKVLSKEEALNWEVSKFSVEGEGLYKYLNTLNHSCDPNCVLACTTDDFKLSLIALKDIKAGEELTISYIDNSMNKETRLKTLMDQYNFDCKCKKCCGN
ncbi:set and mynd domain containing protein, putative [Entamoeba invadens IP1]|uniref:Set and mynd domain containing protein, putative n=2 Tax=Entamoeba invadens TaxID=33085 RepID=A0A0A1UBI7_ENTIV|nr:set and mynd domain containing protein, putative [Entamoeba invadens IP1]ELP92579.1 set and mynd domain containing protein, putative [Entamoeba invadens IP1]BAN41978.1 set and mynd domain containing protein, putative [Entamoeba invadens]|eukprot:XP_004259350.1 set and mynd domain containing protein, putative [Entamoeba invadens IP1]